MAFIRTSTFLFTVWAAVIFLAAGVVFAQPPRSQFLNFFADRIDSTEMAALDRGEVVVKVLPSADKREISVLGIVKLRLTKGVDMTFFRESLSQRDSKSRLGGGKFSIPPDQKDLDKLEVGERDLSDLRRCVIGKCGIKLSAEMINAIQMEVDWNSADSPQRVTAVYKRLLTEYVDTYTKRGDRGLIIYADQRRPVRLADEIRSLLGGSRLLDLLTPQLGDYLRNYPSGELAGVESRIDWTIVDSGLKPILTITHSVSLSADANETTIHMIATKQIYANHYVDASLALSTLVRFTADDRSEAYLVFSNVSRSDSLGGVFSSMAHAVAERQAVEKVSGIMDVARQRLEAKGGGRTATPVGPEDNREDSQILALTRNWLARVVALVFVVFVAAFLLLRRRGRNTDR